jgi:RNA polymerase sigma factor (sigma-70 family)
MSDPTDRELLEDYVLRHSEPAFAALVSKHVDLVYSAALRVARQPELAEDVTQKTFAAFARSASRLVRHPVPAGWLHKTATNLAADAVRSEIRRRNREQEAAMIMQNPPFKDDDEAIWSELSRCLDAELASLRDDERNALFLRYFEGRTVKEIALRVGAGEEAVQKRISRALQRLRIRLAGRGLAAGVETLGICLATKAVSVAPTGLAASVSKAALSISAVSPGSSFLKLILMTSAQKKLTALVVVVVLCMGGISTVALKRHLHGPVDRAAEAAAIDVPLERYTGEFSMEGHELVLSRRGKGLSIRGARGGGAPFVAYPQSETEFVSHDQGSLTTLTFERDAAGRATAFRLVRDGQVLGDLRRSEK